MYAGSTPHAVPLGEASLCHQMLQIAEVIPCDENISRKLEPGTQPPHLIQGELSAPS